MNEHEWFEEQITGYLSGGLSAEEKSRFDAHRAACAACAKEFEGILETEQTMTQLFAPIAPGLDFEDRLIARLRLRGPRLRINPIARRVAVAAAAAIVLGGFGYVANRQIETGGLDPIRFASNLRQIGQATLLYANEGKGAYPQIYYDGNGREQSAFGGGSNTALNWNNWQRKQSETTVNDQWTLGRRALSLGWNDGSNANKQNIQYGDGHVEFQQHPFVGVQRDMIYPRRSIGSSDIAGKPLNGDDSVLAPTDDGDGPVVSQKITNGPISQDRERVSLEINGNVADNSRRTPAQSAPADLNFYAGSRITTMPEKSKTEVEATGLPLGNRGESLGLNKRLNDYYKPADATKEPVAAHQLAGEELKPVTGFAFGLDTKKDGETTTPGQPVDAPAAPATPPLAHETTPADSSPPASTQAVDHKIIRNGQIEFEVDSFDSATLTITKIVIEEHGYVATTNSEKLPNGKVKGEIVVRVPPDHLDTLVLKLRGIGDLKSQHLTADDVTKQYTDTASELRAAQAMQERLLSIIKSSQGQIKDLLAAEKELATWREKIEKLEGEIRYYDNLVAMSTLNISVFERDIKTAASAKESENVDIGVEADDVEAQRASAIKAIEDAKGRVVQSEMKKLDAGQLEAKIVADIPPENAGPAIDRLRQLGQVARFESTRSQSTPDGQPPLPGAKLERGDTHVQLSLYNLANIAPRQTDNLNLAADDVETAYHAIVSRVLQAGGRIVTSNLNRQTDQQTSGVIQFEVKSTDADAALSDIRKTGEVTRLTIAENPDTSNVTAAKRGFNVQVVSLASMLPREVNNRTLAARDVDASFKAMLEVLHKQNARIVASNTEDAGQGNRNGYLDFEIPRGQIDAIEKALSSAGETVDRNVLTSADADNVTDAKVQYKLKLLAASTLPPKQTDQLAIEVGDVGAAAGSIESAATSMGGRLIDSNFSKDAHGETSRLIIEIPWASSSQALAQARQLGTVRDSQQSSNPQAASGELARARIELTLASGEMLVAPEHGVLATLRNGLSTSFAGLMWSLQLIVIGLCLVAPWMILIWAGVKLLRRSRRKTVTPAT